MYVGFPKHYRHISYEAYRFIHLCIYLFGVEMFEFALAMLQVITLTLVFHVQANDDLQN